MTEEVWTTENSQHLVQKYVRVCNVLGATDGSKQDLIELAHRAANEQQTSSQEEYALEFAKGLKIAMIRRFGQHSVDHIAEQSNQPAPIVIPATPSPRVFAERLKPSTTKTVEEWEAEGLRFRPAVSRVVLAPIQEPQDHTPRRRPLESAMDLQDKSVAAADSAPWGKSATRMAAWAWEILHPGKTIPVNQATLIGNVLSVLHHAGILREGAIIPVGYGHKADVRGMRKEK